MKQKPPPLVENLRQAWKRDRLGVFGVGAAVAAVAIIALPFSLVSGQQNYYGHAGIHLSPWLSSVSPIDGKPYAEVYLAALLGISSLVSLLYRAGSRK